MQDPSAALLPVSPIDAASGEHAVALEDTARGARAQPPGENVKPSAINDDYISGTIVVVPKRHSSFGAPLVLTSLLSMEMIRL